MLSPYQALESIDCLLSELPATFQSSANLEIERELDVDVDDGWTIERTSVRD